MQKKYQSASSLFKTGLFWIWISILIILFDHYTKMWASAVLFIHESFRVFPVLNFTLAYNKGAAFSFLNSASGWQNIFFVTLAFMMSVGIFIWLYNISRRAWWTGIALSLILGGALGNAWDRLTWGYVVDFIHFHLGNWNFAIFNIADSSICIGAIMLLIKWTLPEKYLKKYK